MKELISPIRRLRVKHRSFSVADDLDYTTLGWLNPDFARLTRNKTITKSCAGFVSFADMEKVEKCSRSLLEGNSHSLWLPFHDLRALGTDALLQN